MPESESGVLRVEVAYAEPGAQFLQALTLPEGATIAAALAASELSRRFPALDLALAKLGVFSRPATPATRLRDGDRVEVYRPLLANPKAVRRERAERNRVKPARPG
jgi:putative ubiquitin-RnfH superfamily antitoxin RatB of RatAB toxin-antitoxin module